MDFHPFIVHFPLALLTVGFFCDAAGILFRRDHLLHTGYLLLVLGAVSAIAASLTGNAAEETAARIPGIAAELERHESISTAATWLAIVLVLLRTHLILKRKFTGTVRFAYLAGAAATAVLIALSGYTGGRMTYEYGPGIRPVMEALTHPEGGETVEGRR
ncbi:MAG: DUF2231 domain-containing protein [Gemmatimonadetes bacterium]|nr:DUF2231 domain-containing protein [Gemmatimonadota bacterium]MDE3257871.1 DUF2231 domain-containing protein [Gemmatimonadota bacterium]